MLLFNPVKGYLLVLNKIKVRISFIEPNDTMRHDTAHSRRMSVIITLQAPIARRRL